MLFVLAGPLKPAPQRGPGSRCWPTGLHVGSDQEKVIGKEGLMLVSFVGASLHFMAVATDQQACRKTRKQLYRSGKLLSCFPALDLPR